MIIGTILKNAIKILATNPKARKKAGEVALKAVSYTHLTLPTILLV